MSSTLIEKFRGAAPVHVQLTGLAPYSVSGAPGAGVQVTGRKVLGRTGLKQVGSVYTASTEVCASCRDQKAGIAGANQSLTHLYRKD